MDTDSRLSLLIDQLEIVLILVQRPSVQRQLLALLAVVVAASAVALLLRWLVTERGLPFLRSALGEERYGRLRRWLTAARHLYFPVLGIALIPLTVRLMTVRGWAAGLVSEAAGLFLILLAYRLLVAAVYGFFNEKQARTYHTRLLLPIFVWIIVSLLVSRVIELSSLAEIELFTLFENQITLGRMVLTAVVVYLSFVLAWILQDLLRKVVMPYTDADPGVTNSVLTVSRYLFVFIGIFIAIGTLGVDLSTLAIIGGGLSIGIGIGLQEIIANFIGGIVLLFEQSLRPGDVIEIDGKIGTVEKLNFRSTIVRTNDNVEVVVPNEDFFTSKVTTFTRTSRLVRINLYLGVGYDSDPKQIRTILEETAVKHGLVKNDPPPHIFFQGFGDSSLDFRVAVWIDQPHRAPRVRSDLYFMIWEAFAKHDIEIPFPQRDLNLRRGWEKVLAREETVVVDEDGGGVE